MGTIRPAVKIALVMIVVGAIAAVSLPPAKVHLRLCGHPEDSWSRLSRITGVRFGATHCCSSGGLVTDLRMMDAAQSIYHEEHGAYATSLEQLTNVHLPSMSYTFHFVSDGQHWSAAVPQQNSFAGNYLFTSDRKLHFSTKGAATTNDLDLFDSTQR